MIEGTHFRPNVLREAFFPHVHETQNEWYAWCFEMPWRFLLVLGDGITAVFHGGLQGLRRQYLEAALAFADVLDAVGERFVDLGRVRRFSGEGGILAGLSNAAGEVADERTQLVVSAIRERLLR